MRSVVGLAILAVVFAAGCSSVDTVVSPQFGSYSVKSVAVVHVTGDVSGEAARNQIADFFAAEFLRKGYRVVERQQAVAVLKEQESKLPAAGYDEQAVFIGRLLGVDGVIVVNIPKFDRSMNLTAKLLTVKDGSTVWISSGEAETGEVGYTILGATAGAIGGAILGNSAFDQATLGGIAGGVVGGVVGNALSPQTATKLKKTVKKMVADVPQVGMQVAQ